MGIWKILFFLLGADACWAMGQDSKVVYGVDNRMEVSEAQDDRYREWAQSTAAMIANYQLQRVEDTGNFNLNSNLLEQMNICPSERFAQQMNPAVCSGFLVAPNILITAGHCVSNPSHCEGYRWVFGLSDIDDGIKDLQIPASKVYECKRIIKSKLTSWNKNDFSVIELDRPVMGITPLEMNTTSAIKPGTPIVVIGHPSGLPTKIADGAVVRERRWNYFRTNLDTFGGNSGSAVINEKTGKVEGILVRGQTDYIYSSTQGCMVVNRYEDQAGGGEDATYIRNASVYLP